MAKQSVASASDSFFPEDDYSVPDESNYMKFNDGDNRFRVLSKAVVGYEYWNLKGDVVRSKEQFSPAPSDIKPNQDGSAGKVQHFWAFVVWNYEGRGKVQILEIKQKGIMKYMEGLIKNPAWGSPKGYDIVINKSGSGLLTEYTNVANPHKELDADIVTAFEATNINLDNLFVGKDPFEG